MREILKYILVPACFFITLVSQSQGFEKNTIEKGVLDLSNHPFDESEIMELNGEWEFYWAKLLTPEILSSNSNLKPTSFLKIPGLWNDFDYNGIKLSGEGFATLRLLIHAPQFKGKLMRLKLGRIETAYKLYIDDNLVVETGKVGTSEQTMSPCWRVVELDFTPKNETIQILLQISNFKHRKGGVSSYINIGTEATVSAKSSRNMAIEMFLIGVLIIMAMHHFGLFSLRIKDLAALNFGLLCFFTAFAMLTSGEFILIRTFPDFNWEWVVKLNFLNNYFRMGAFSMFIALTFPDHVSKKVANTILIWAISMSVFVIVTPAKINSYTLLIFEIGLIVTVIYNIYGMVKAYVSKYEGAAYAIWGTIILCLTAINDMLLDAHIIQTVSMSPIGTFVFIFSQSFMLSLRSSRSYTAVEKLSTRLLSLDKIKNEFLESTGHRLDTPIEVLVKNVGAQKGYLVLKKNNSWKIEIEILANGRVINNLENKFLTFDNISDSIELSINVVTQVIETQESVLLSNASEDIFYKNDSYIKNNRILSIICMPLVNRGKIEGLIYLENNARKGAFDEETQNILNLLSSQTSSLIDNALMFTELADLNRNLEDKVKERTMEVLLQKEEIESQRDEIEKSNVQLHETLAELSVKNRDLTDSINYSKRIQESILPEEEYIKALFPNSFIFFKPKDILSGDFYWFEQVFVSNKTPGIKTEQVIAAAVDCTGHGVPGALMSIIANDLLNYAVHELGLNTPATILDAVQEGIKTKLKQKDRNSSQDGMDIALISYQRNTNLLQFAGAKNPLLLVRNNEITEYEGDRLSIGGLNQLKMKSIQNFTNIEINILPGDRVYLLTDGYLDQFGGANERKFGKKRFHEFLLKIQTHDFTSHKSIISKNISDWKGDSKQIDDMLVIGIQF